MSQEDQYKVYLSSKVNPIMEDLVTSLIITRPDNPIPFMIQKLQEKAGLTSGMTKAEQEELTFLRSEVKRLKAKCGEIDDGAHSEIESSDDDDDDDEVEDLNLEELKKKQQGKGPRTSVSAEVYGIYYQKGDFVPKVIEKSDDVKKRIRERLSTAFMFNGLDENEKDIILNAMGETNFKKGDAVINQGDDGDVLYVVESGRLSCSKVFKKGDDATYLKDYHPGEAFGELALLYNAPRAASIKAEEDCILYTLDRECFNHIVKDAAAKRRERYEEFLSGVEILSSMDAYERSQISDALKSETFDAGAFVVEQGATGNNFYIIEEGEAVATKVFTEGQAAQEVMSYKKGDYFGELALLRNEPRAANVVAKTALKVVSLDRYSFKRMLGPLEDILKRNVDKYAKYAAK